MSDLRTRLPAVKAWDEGTTEMEQACVPMWHLGCEAINVLEAELERLRCCGDTIARRTARIYDDLRPENKRLMGALHHVYDTHILNGTPFEEWLEAQARAARDHEEEKDA